MKRATMLTIGVVALLTASNAHASETGEGDGSTPGLFGAVHPEVAARMMAGATLTSSDSEPGPMTGGGLGVRAGASYLGFYGGLSFIDFMSERYGSAGNTEDTHAASYGVELGYGTTLFRLLTLRGQLGVGDYAVASDWTVSRCSGAPSCSMPPMRSLANGDNLYLAPGLLLQVTLGPVLVGVDGNLFYMPSWSYPQSGTPHGQGGTFAALMAGAQLGVRL
jgi:hypothetical protein